MPFSDLDRRHMQRALELAEGGRGRVEPNPLVGCVIARGEEIIAEGFHQQYGGPHAEAEALAAAGDRARGATIYVTLEPCCHQGKTPPCSQAVIAAQPVRVVVATGDPFPQVAGGGVKEIQAAGIPLELGLLETEARAQNAPFFKLIETGRPWVISKWAMTLDGRIATAAGESRWISNEVSRRRVHELRGRMDAILVGSGTARTDDPRLTARPPGPRTPLRVVLDSHGRLGADSQLVQTLEEAPLLVVVGPHAAAKEKQRLADLGVEVFACTSPTATEQIDEVLEELGRRRLTNLLVEGGAGVLGAFYDAAAIDEVHAFIAPRIVGGAGAPGPPRRQGCHPDGPGPRSRHARDRDARRRYLPARPRGPANKK